MYDIVFSNMSVVFRATFILSSENQCVAFSERWHQVEWMTDSAQGTLYYAHSLFVTKLFILVAQYYLYDVF